MDGDLDSTLAAIAEPTRRQIIDLLVDGPLPSGRIALKLNLSPPTTSRHLRVLWKANLVREVRVEHDARVTMYELDRDALLLVKSWVDRMERQWASRLEDFKAYAEQSAAGFSDKDDPERSRKEIT